MIWKKFKVKVSANKIRLFYRRNDMRYKQTALKYYPHGRHLAQLENERMEFAALLTDYIVEDKSIIYMDETTFNCDCQ